MANEAKFKASLDDKVSSKLDKIRDKFNTIGGKGTAASLFGNLGAQAAGAALNIVGQAIGAVVGAFGEMQAAYREDQASQAKLRASLFANVAAFSGNIKVIEGVIESRMRLGFADDEQRDSLANLVSVTKDSTKALGLQRTAMDLARLRGMSLENASLLLGKVYAGNLGILARYGIVLKKGATATEALAEIQKRAAGQAEAFAETSEGKLVASQVRAGEVMERFGKVIDKIVQQVLPPLVSGLEFVADAFESLGIGVDKTMEDVKDAADRGSQAAQARLRAMAQDMGISVEQMVAKSKAAARESTAAIKDQDASWNAATSAFAGALPEDMEDAKDKAVAVARRTPQDIANALREKRATWQDALGQLKEDFDRKMTSVTELAKIKGALTGDRLARGLKSRDPIIKAQAEATRQILVDRLIQMGGRAKVYGQKIVDQLAAGIRSRIATLVSALRLLAQKQADYLEFGSPAKEGPGSHGGGPEGWSRRMVQLYAKGMAPGPVERASSRLAGASIPGRMGGGFAAAGPSYGFGGESFVPAGPIVIQLDGQKLAELIDNRLFYRRMTSPR
jgi:hypothetical protein